MQNIKVLFDKVYLKVLINLLNSMTKVLAQHTVVDYKNESPN